MILMRIVLLLLFAAFAYLVVRSFSPFAAVLTVALVGGAIIAFLFMLMRKRGQR